jgi:hypothetical protein
MNGESSDSPPPSRQSSKLKLAGIIILAIGVVIAGVVYELGQRAADTDLDPSMIGYDKQQNAQMERMYGKSGELMEDLSNSLKQPGTQAGIILAVSIVASLICFRFAKPIPEEEKES